MIKCLLTDLGRARQENIWLSVRTHGPNMFVLKITFFLLGMIL